VRVGKVRKVSHNSSRRKRSVVAR